MSRTIGIVMLLALIAAFIHVIGWKFIAAWVGASGYLFLMIHLLGFKEKKDHDG